MSVKQKQSNMEKIILIAFMFLPTLAVSINLDNDFWFLVNHGRYIVNNGFPILEPFTIHENMDFIIQQWMFDVVVHYLYLWFDKLGVIVFVFVSAIIICILTYKICMLISENKFYLSVLITAYIYLLMCIWFLVTRPQIVTYIIILIEIWCLEKYVKKNESKYLIGLPFLSVALINFHSSMWWMFFAFLLPYLIETVKNIKQNSNLFQIKSVILFISTIIAALAGMINPYGYKAVIYIFKSFGDKAINQNILEMSVPDVKTLHGGIFFATATFIVICYVVNRTGKVCTRYLLLLLGTTLLALMSIKSIPYFLIGSLLPMAFYLKNVAHKLVFGGKPQKRLVIPITAIFVLLVYAASIFVIYEEYDATKDYPNTKEAIDFLTQNNDVTKVSLYTSFFDGGYAEWKGIKSYIDARAEVFLETNNNKKDIFEEYISLQSGEVHYRDFFENYSFTHILVNETDILDNYLSEDNNYQLYYSDEFCKIYIPIKE